MQVGSRVALGVGVGYLLGRTKKMRLALMLVATGALGGRGSLLEQGKALLASSPQLTSLVETVRVELIGRTKDAALTAATSRADALNERLRERASELPGRLVPEGADQAARPLRSATGRVRQPDDEQSGPEPDNTEPDEVEPDETGEAPPGRSTRRSPVRRSSR